MGSQWHEVTAAKRRALAFHAVRAHGNQSEAAHRLGVRREILNRAIAVWGGPKALLSQPHVEHGVTCDLCSQEHMRNGNGGNAVTLTDSPVLTYGQAGPTFRQNMQEAASPAEAATERIPPVTVELSPEEDYFVSQEIARNRLTGGPRTRTHVLRAALRFFMESRGDKA